ncbi:hypothetical protein BH10BAC1_BH10BAC1_05150 [soil metagenome]
MFGFFVEPRFPMNIKKLLFTILYFTAHLFSGCYTTSFLPQTHNVPLFTGEKQIRITPTHSIRAAELQLAYAPINHLGIIANIQATPRYYMPEIGVGAFYSTKNILVTEVYLGFGTGKLKDSLSYYDRLLSSSDKFLGIDITTYKFFLQPNLGVRFSEKIDLSFSAKCTYWYFPKYHYHYERWEYFGTSSPRLNYTEHVDEKDGYGITIEPAITFRIGGEHTKFMIQTGFSASHETGDLVLSPYRDNYAFVRLGVSVNFSLFKKKEEILPNQNH